MPITFTFHPTQLPNGSSITGDGSDLIIRIKENQRFPHITFHADQVVNNDETYSVTYNHTPFYHVVIRPGVY